MKRASRFFPTLAVLPLLWTGCPSPQGDAHPVMALQIPEVHPTKRFSLDCLTPEQQAACAKFRAKTGSSRRTEWEEILKSGALPIYALQMTQEDIIRLLGEPALRDTQRGDPVLGYALEQTQRQEYLQITFHGGHAVMIWITTTIS